ncbi:AI-2E family transporter [Gracilibacillus sp. YIM 98692]|uniref:AI-2E family transporter n=1 Tax=Gracilibacillus sp. YIM 98692 TaxID=2663532 RepID=UPI003204A111
MRLLFEKKSTHILLTLIFFFGLIYLIYLTRFIFAPIGAYLTAIAVPIIGAGMVFYITNPIVNWLERRKVPRVGGTFIVFFVIILVLTIGIVFIAPIVQQQFSNFVESVPKMVENTEQLLKIWQDNQNIIPQQFENSIQNITNNLDGYAEKITSTLFDVIGEVFGFVFAFFLIPFFLFFMLKDGHKFVPCITKFLSPSKSSSFQSLAAKINHTLSSFIQGQFIVSVCVGVMLYIGYVIIGLNYSLSLALFGLIMNFIPFVGPFLSAIPAIIVGLFQDPMIALWALVVMVIAQQLESNFISPNVMGRALSLHPLTVITLILAAGAIAGFLGLLFIIPAYAVVKTIISHFYEEWRKKQPENNPELF